MTESDRCLALCRWMASQHLALSWDELAPIDHLTTRLRADGLPDLLAQLRNDRFSTEEHPLYGAGWNAGVRYAVALLLGEDVARQLDSSAVQTRSSGPADNPGRRNGAAPGSFHATARHGARRDVETPGASGHETLGGGDFSGGSDRDAAYQLLAKHGWPVVDGSAPERSLIALAPAVATRDTATSSPPPRGTSPESSAPLLADHHGAAAPISDGCSICGATFSCGCAAKCSPSNWPCPTCDRIPGVACWFDGNALRYHGTRLDLARREAARLRAEIEPRHVNSAIAHLPPLMTPSESRDVYLSVSHDDPCLAHGPSQPCSLCADLDDDGHLPRCDRRVKDALVETELWSAEMEDNS